MEQGDDSAGESKIIVLRTLHVRRTILILSLMGSSFNDPSSARCGWEWASHAISWSLIHIRVFRRGRRRRAAFYSAIGAARAIRTEVSRTPDGHLAAALNSQSLFVGPSTSCNRAWANRPNGRDTPMVLVVDLRFMLPGEINMSEEQSWGGPESYISTRRFQERIGMERDWVLFLTGSHSCA